MTNDEIQTDGTICDHLPVAAKNMGISRSQLYGALREGRVHGKKAGNRVMISRAEQRRWFDALPNAAFGEKSA